MRRSSPHASEIALSAQARSKSRVRISVEDQGPGIPAEDLSRIFDRFYRVKPGSPEAGVGLGLAIARGIIQAHGGRVGAESQVGQGTTVWFTLPVAEAPGKDTNRTGAQVIDPGATRHDD
jgi:signal transduction histidine kinase